MHWANAVDVVSGFMIVISQACRWGSAAGGIAFDFSIPYVSVSISLNILLTLMIVARLVLHGGDLRATIGSPVGINGLYRTVATMLIESSALFAVNSLLLIGLWGARSGAADVFLPIVAEIQVRAFLRPGILDRLSNVKSDYTGHCTTTHYPTSRQPEIVDVQHCRHWKDQFVPL